MTYVLLLVQAWLAPLMAGEAFFGRWRGGVIRVNQLPKSGATRLI